MKRLFSNLIEPFCRLACSIAFPDAWPEEITLPCPLAKHSAAVRRAGMAHFKRPAHFQFPLPLNLLQ
jgi:hypothetical protein